MKKIFFIASLFFSIAAQAQNDTSTYKKYNDHKSLNNPVERNIDSITTATGGFLIMDRWGHKHRVAAPTTTVATNGITDALIRQSSALSVIGRSANSTGNVADMSAGTDKSIMSRNGSTIGFNLIDSTYLPAGHHTELYFNTKYAAIGATGGITALTSDITASGTGSVAATIAGHAVTFAKQQQVAGLSIPGVTGNSTADMAAITFGTDKFGLFREGTTLVAKKADSSNVTGVHTENYFNTKYAPITGIPLASLSQSSAATNQLPQWNGTAWIPTTPVTVTLTSPTDGQILEWDASGSQFINVDNNPTVAAPTIIERIVGTGAAPIEGDSTYVASECDGSQCKIHLDGLLLMSDSVNGAYVDTATGKITFGHYLHTGQKIIIETINYTAGTIGASLEDLTFPTQSGLVNTVSVWTGTSTADYHNNYGLSGKKLAGGTDGYIESRYTASDATYGVMAFNTSNTNQRYTDNPGSPTVYYYEAGWVIIGGGVLSYLDNNAAQSSTGYTLSTGDYIRVERTSGVLKLQTSPDHTVWTDRHTYTAFNASGNSNNDLFININIDALIGVSKVYNPKGYNLQ